MLFRKLFGQSRWVVLDCLNGTLIPIERYPFEIGSAADVDLRLESEGVAAKHCSIQRGKAGGIVLASAQSEAPVQLNGRAAALTDLVPEQDHTLVVGGHLFLLRGGRNLSEWTRQIDPSLWFILDPASGRREGPVPLSEIRELAQNSGLAGTGSFIPKGAGAGFDYETVARVTAAIWPEESEADVAALVEGAAIEAPFDEQPPLAPDQGSLTCPVCWLRFDPGDIMHVAVHDALRGDPVLGEDVPQRFQATRFNDRSQALDAFGLPSTEIACPHCRRVLPPGFLDVPHHIFSIVGDQSAGKSYYLSVLVKLLPASLYRNFDVVFQDADPAGNAMLNDMKKTLFSAQTPEQAKLVKTQLEGAMYERLPRFGRVVALPKPFIFSVSSAREPQRRFSAIFYDNAGEHFQPGRDSADSPGAQHVASSTGIFFLFDPFNHPEFRKALADHPDPQLEKPLVDQQDLILSELLTRLRKLLRLDPAEKVSIPLAVLVGKCDAWIHLLEAEPLRNAVHANELSLAAVRENSQRVRRLMLQLCPTIVANAESISSNVEYFPVSSFGHPPVKIGQGNYVPDPRRLEPVLVEIPALWLLAQARPDLIKMSAAE